VSAATSTQARIDRGLEALFLSFAASRPLEFTAVDWDVVLKDAHQISAGFAARLKARSADALHVAILEQVNPDLFVSGDKDQLRLATARPRIPEQQDLF
jgi:predicted nucleic acid-binding protein